MTNLSQLLTELKEKAAKASEGTWRFGLDTPSRGYVHANKIIVADKVYVADGEYITACSPETILALCEALEEAREVVEFYGNRENYYTRSVKLSCGCCSDVLDCRADEDEGNKARAFLAKYFPRESV